MCMCGIQVGGVHVDAIGANAMDLITVMSLIFKLFGSHGSACCAGIISRS